MSPPILPANIAWLHALITLAVVLPFITKHALRSIKSNWDPVFPFFLLLIFSLTLMCKGRVWQKDRFYEMFS